jgi:hypothetical protein
MFANGLGKQLANFIENLPLQFLFLIGQFLWIFSSEPACPKWTEIWQEAFIESSLHRLLICFLPISSLFGQAVSEKKIFRNFLIKSKNCLWRPCLLTDRDEIRNLHKRHFIDALQHVSVHLSLRKPLVQMNWYWVFSINGRFSIKFANCFPNPLANMDAIGNSFFW